MKCCNWKAQVAVAVAAVALWTLAPGSVAAVAPLLVIAICPLLMLLMMRAMRSGGSRATHGDNEVSKLRAELDELRAERTTGAPEA